MRREFHVRFCEGGRVRFPSATRRVITCTSATEARAALMAASRVLGKLGVNINPQKTRIVHVRHGFEFLGYKIKRGGRPMRLPTSKIRTRAQPGALYAYPREKSIRHFKDQIRRLTRRNAPVSTQELIKQANPVVRGWGHHYKRAHVRKLFHRLDGWLVRRIWSHRFGKWRCCGWATLPAPFVLSSFDDTLHDAGPGEMRPSLHTFVLADKISQQRCG